MALLLRARVRGQAMILVSIMVGTGVLFGFVALAVDGGSILLQRRQMQNAADAAALGAVRLLADNIVWGPDPVTGTNGPIYLVTFGQLKDNIAQLASANGVHGNLGYTIQVEFATCTGSPSCEYSDWGTMATNTSGAWSPSDPSDYNPTKIVSSRVDALRITTQINSPTIFAKIMGWNSVSVRATAAAALSGNKDHHLTGPTWPMTAFMGNTTSNTIPGTGDSAIDDYLFAGRGGLCDPAIFYNNNNGPGTDGFHNLVSLSAVQGCSFSENLDCSSSEKHAQLIGWHDGFQLLGYPAPRAELLDKAGIFSGRSFQSRCVPTSYQGETYNWSPSGSCSNTPEPSWNIWINYGTICCRNVLGNVGILGSEVVNLDTSDTDIPNWIYYDFMSPGQVIPKEAAFRGASGVYPGNNKWRDVDEDPPPTPGTNDWRLDPDSPPNDALLGDWLETYIDVSLPGGNIVGPQQVVGPIRNYIDRSGTKDVLSDVPVFTPGSPGVIQNYGEHLDRVMYLYGWDYDVSPPNKGKEVWTSTCITCTHEWMATTTSPPDRVHIVQNLKFRFYKGWTQDDGGTFDLHPLCSFLPNPYIETHYAAVYGFAVGEVLDKPPDSPAPHDMYNYVGLIDANE